MRLEGWRFPEVEWIDRLDVIVTIEKHRRLAPRLQPVGIDDRMAGRLDDLCILESNALVLLGQVARGATDVTGALRLTRDARDPEKVFEFLQPLVAGIFKEFFRRGHCWRRSS